MEVFFAVLVGVGFGYIFFLMRKDPEEKEYIKKNKFILEKTDEYTKILLKNQKVDIHSIHTIAKGIAREIWEKNNS